MIKKKSHNFKTVQHGIHLKKEFGQHFLRDQNLIDFIVSQVELQGASVFEIGCGDGFLTKSILKESIARLWVFEIDKSWANYVKANFPDSRMVIFEEDILKVDFSRFIQFSPWVLLANLPYQITFGLLFKMADYRNLFKEGIIMVQEEVAQKIVKNNGRGYGFSSLYLQYFFDWKLLKKIPPSAFYPPPSVFSRLLYFKPKENLIEIPKEEEFWKFIKRIFSQPRRNLRNNLKNYHYGIENLSDETLNLRAQQMSFEDLLEIWKIIYKDHN